MNMQISSAELSQMFLQNSQDMWNVLKNFICFGRNTILCQMKEQAN